MTENERKHLIEGYKSLTQYGCQMSADHISTDRIMIPVSLAPAFFVLAPQNVEITNQWAETLILMGGISLILFWMFRNSRSKKRLYAIWDILRLIETKLGFEAYLRLLNLMKTRACHRFWLGRILPPSDFTLKFWFGVFALAFYCLVTLHVWCPDVISWFCC